LELRKTATKLYKMLKSAMEMLVCLIYVFKWLKRFGKGHEDPEARSKERAGIKYLKSRKLLQKLGNWWPETVK